jgi:predicted DNA-binding transcriptional regulator AlpA
MLVKQRNGDSVATQTQDAITRPEFAALARVSVPTLRRWARAGIGPRPRKLGPRLVRYDRDEVMAYLRHGERRGAS